MNLFCIVPYSVEGWIPPAPARLKSFLKGHDIDSEVLDLNLEIFKNILDPTLAKQIADWCTHHHQVAHISICTIHIYEHMCRHYEFNI